MGRAACPPWRRPGARALGAVLAAAILSALATLPAGAASDPGVTSDAPGRTVFRDPVNPDVLAPAPSARGTTVARTPYPLRRTFALHSLPGSEHTILLDFDGATVADSAWNQADIGLPAGSYRGWVTDGSAAFSDIELAAIQSIWQRVSEDYAPFDIDVTTQDPGPDALGRAGPDDPAYGTRVVVSSSNAAMKAVCASYCSGSAFFDVVDLATAHDFWQPAWVFPRMVGNDVKDAAETISHEVGHNFGLLHDGSTRDSYYDGHGSWAPIMGVGFDRPITQWSRGDYADADNQQDDLALIAAHGAPLRADEAGSTPAGAASLPSGPAYITDNADVDVYSLGSCAGTVTVSARPAPVSPDLDIRISLLGADGSVVATANPRSSRVGRDRATGLSAAVGAAVPSGSYYVAVTGVGRGGAVRGYDGYASVGSYTLRQQGCSGPA